MDIKTKFNLRDLVEDETGFRDYVDGITIHVNHEEGIKETYSVNSSCYDAEELVLVDLSKDEERLINLKKEIESLLSNSELNGDQKEKLANLIEIYENIIDWKKEQEYLKNKIKNQ